MGKPVNNISVGGVQVAVWENTVGENTILSVTASKSYQDPKTNEWKSTTSFKLNEIPFLIRALQLVWDDRYVKQKQSVESEGF